MEFLPWDMPDDFVSAEVETFVRNIKNGLLIVLFLFGAPANVINMAVFYKQSLKDRVNLCLFSLSVFDVLYLTSCMFVHTEDFFLQFSGGGFGGPVFTFMINNNLNGFFGFGFVSFFLNGVVACERCYCVLRPLKYQTVLRTRTMGLIILGVSPFIICPFFFVVTKYTVGCIYDSEIDLMLMIPVMGDTYRAHKDLVDLLDSVIYGAILPGGSMLVVTTATTITTIRLRQVMTWRTETSSSLSPREVALTKMLIGTSVLFIVCLSPAFVIRIAGIFFPELHAGELNPNLHKTSVWIIEAFSFINSSVNFLVYYVMGSKYRETFWSIFGRKTEVK